MVPVMDPQQPIKLKEKYHMLKSIVSTTIGISKNNFVSRRRRKKENGGGTAKGYTERDG